MWARGHGDFEAGAHPRACFLTRPFHDDIRNTPSHVLQGQTNYALESLLVLGRGLPVRQGCALKEALGTRALGMVKVDSGDHRHAGGPMLDDVAQRTHATFQFVGHGNICKCQRTVMTL
jgi:hypothetical protein